ncbi:gp53-like domain-containing protein [Photorhabdus tasmaniensis]|uniref:Putative tail fiber protein gp53-like C-terminal domain-containing protein n=1 Tax=Photorhabdus tasmaniensis TaxID=1004159 RepID=A0ABX0GLN9_9GAMM|nr:tail fiber protein [Photorhabdus tasmaniensis]NHB89182.1 hypothetical protein [Photorhabdus tasmaniensis]
MFGLDNPSGVSVMPPITPASNPTPLWFTEGGAGLAVSYPGQEWFNIVQAELLAVLQEAGIKPDKSKLNQLAVAIKSIAAERGIDLTDKLGNSSALAASQKLVTEVNDNANNKLAKNQNGADIPDKNAFVKNLGLSETVELAQGAYPRSGGVLDGNMDAVGSISGKGVYEYPSIRVYSAVNKPSPGELGAYTTGECNGKFQLRGSGLLSIDSDNARFNGHVLAWLDEVNRNYQPRGNYQPAGNYAPTGLSYTKSESDSRYGSKNTALKSSNGWWKCNDTGMIYQWGLVERKNDTTAVNFPIVYPNKCFNIQLTLGNAYRNSSSNIVAYEASNSGFACVAYSQEVWAYWFAMGY